MPVSDARIKLHFNVHEPIELTDLTLSFAAFAGNYQRYITQKLREEGKKTRDVKVSLYITEIKNNCILAELAGATAILGELFPLMNYTNVFVDFIRNIDAAVRYFGGLPKKVTKDFDPNTIPYAKKECADLDNFLKIVGQQKGAIGLSVAEFKKETKEEKIYARYEYTNEMANAARKGAILAQSLLEARGDADYKKVLMFFHQTNSDESKTEGKTGERVIIRTVSEKPLPVYIVSQLDKERLMSQKDDPNLNPFKVSYLVDVNVETDRHGIPKHYRVLKIHDVIPDDSQTD